MKKTFCILLILMFAILFSAIGFADTIDPNAPGEAQTVSEDMYPVITETPPPPPPTPTAFDFPNSNVPASGELAQTGGIPAGAFYAVGGFCIILAFIISRKKGKNPKAD